MDYFYYKRFNKLKNIVESNNTNDFKFMIYYKTILVILKTFYREIILKKLRYLAITYLFNNENYIKELSKEKYEIGYTLNSKLYKLIINVKKGPKNIICVTDEHNKDITDIIEQYSGPNEDFHGKYYTPKCLGYKKLSFIFSNGSEKKIDETEKIKI